MRRHWLVALGLASACGGQLRPRPTGADYVEAIRIAGNRAIASDALEPGLALHEAVQSGAAADPFLVALDADRIRAAYWRRGFFDASVATRVERRDHAQVVVFTVVEGRRAAARVEIDGLPPEVPLERARALIGLRDGAPFDYDAYDAAKLPLAALVENAGYAHVEVRARVLADQAAALATARYDVVPGPPCRFGEIRFSDVDAALVAAARARLAFATGDRYSASALERSQVEIYQLGRFATVQLVPDRQRGEVIDVAVELALASRHELHIGGGIGYEPATYEVRVRGGGSLVPASRPLWTLASDARVAITVPHTRDTSQLEPKVRGLVSVQRLDLFRPRLRGELEVGADYQKIEAYLWTGTHTRLGLGSPLGASWLQLRVGWMIESITFSEPNCALGVATGCDPVPPGGTPPPGPCDPSVSTLARRLGLCDGQILGAYQASLVADGRDNLIEPHRGLYAVMPVTVGTPFAGGNLSYVQVTPELRGYLSLGGVVIAARARVGAILADPGNVPVTERYYSGGTSGHRGFSVRRLSPLATSGGQSVIYGGGGLLETGIELRRQIGTLWTLPVGVNVFLDGGDVTETPRDLDLRQLYWAVGGGVWSKLVGDFKIRIDAGYLLPSTGRDPPSRDGLENIVWHLGVGESY